MHAIMNLMRLMGVTLLLAVVLVAPGQAQQTATLQPPDRAFMPHDEAASDPSWTRFRERLLTAVQQRDKKFVLGIVDRHVRNGLEQPRGLDEFIRQWSPDAEDSPLWRELPRALFLGAVYYQHERMPRSLCAPYVLPRWPKNTDPQGNGAITARETALRSRPSGSADILANLSYSIVRVTDWEVADADPEAKQQWVKIHAQERDGYIPEEHVRSPLEHLICFRKGEAGWRLTSFLAAGE